MRRSKSYQLQQRLRYWQRALNLRDWFVTAVWVPYPESGNRGLCEVRQEDKSALIRLDAGLRVDARDDFLDAELTLVHELLHIHFDFLGFDAPGPKPKPTLKDQLFEQAIDQAARAIVRQHRGRSNR